ncbi:phosphotransferase [Microlunatus sp. Gsoil 973]|uniref:phosphotransferase n=1 Tax=Microlunatus sp. Gsoil 973 TaxID=2672569 RepID=UPI0018A828D4
MAGCQAITGHIRRLYEESTDRIVSHRDVGPWNVLETPDRSVLIDWENAGPTTATVEPGRALMSFGCDRPARMQQLMEAYRAAGGGIAGIPQHLFNWQLTQHLSRITERIKISVGDLGPEDDPNRSGWIHPPLTTTSPPRLSPCAQKPSDSRRTAPDCSVPAEPPVGAGFSWRDTNHPPSSGYRDLTNTQTNQG